MRIKALFLDIGGVLLTNGWDHHARKRAAKEFELDFVVMENRHQLNVDTYELGKLTLKEYLSRVVFYQRRPFTYGQFWKFMSAQSKPFYPTIELFRQIKERYGLKIVVVSNEARELNSHRIRKYKLDMLVDSFVSSCFVHFRKPDKDIFQVALDTAQVLPAQVVYIEDTPMFVEVAESLGIRGVHHTDYKSTHDKLAALGLDLCDIGKGHL